MSSRGDIIGKSDYSFDDTKYGLIYTKQCGWIDLGHAYPSNGRGDGALYLWKKILRESSEAASGGDDFIVSYHQKMSALKRNISVGIKKRYSIQKGLNISQKKAVFMSIVLDVSNDFEALQGNWVFRNLTNSGFSAEDLISNLISAYRSIDPSTDYIELCEPIDRDLALKIWDTYGPVGERKNKTIKPYLFPLDLRGQPDQKNLPSFLNTINISKADGLFEVLK